MRLNKVLLIGMVLYAIQSVTYAQNIRPLEIGEKVPDLVIKKVFNYPKKTVKISDFKGKLLILDFWGTGCTNCMEALPAIDRVQKKFPDKVIVVNAVLLSGEYPEIAAALKRYKPKAFSNYQMPTTTDVEQLSQYFPFNIVSHVVWIGPDGIVKAITGTEHITEENIQSLLDSKTVNWPVKKDVLSLSTEDCSRPMLGVTLKDVKVPALLYYSALTGPLPGVGNCGMNIDSVKGTIVYNYFNAPLIYLCYGAIDGNIARTRETRDVILDVKEPSRFTLPGNAKPWIWVPDSKENRDLYCYSFSIPLNEKEHTGWFIREDLRYWLSRAFGITIRKEVRKQKVLHLIRTNDNDELIRTKAKNERSEIVLDDTAKKKRIMNTQINALVDHLNNLNNMPYVENRTGLGRMAIDMEFPIPTLTDLKALRKVLHTYGMDLYEIEKDREMYVISDKDRDNHNALATYR